MQIHAHTTSYDLKVRAGGTNTLLPPPQHKSRGDLSPPVPMVVAPMRGLQFTFYRLAMTARKGGFRETYVITYALEFR